MLDDLDERGRRRWAAVEARAWGHGGITAVALATGLSARTIRTGLKERDDPAALAGQRQRQSGGGRPPQAVTQPGLRDARDRLLEPTARGSPLNPLRWTIPSPQRLAGALRKQGYAVSAPAVRRRRAAMPYSLPGTRKTRAGAHHPDRDGPFRHSAERVQARPRRGAPAIAVDTKKKAVLGNRKQAGRTSRPQGNPAQVQTHDVPDPHRGQALPYGVYDMHGKEAVVSVGLRHATAAFAVAAIRRGWEQLGRKRSGRAKRLLVTADSGGRHRSRCRLWTGELQHGADETGLIVEVRPYPPGTRKGNKIEHRVFCHMTRNGRGTPRATLEIVVESIGATTTETGWEDPAGIDEGTDEKGRKVSDEELADCTVQRHAYHGEWNDEIQPRVNK